MAGRRTLSHLLSLALVAFTIEFDNESERQIQKVHPRRRFLVSLVMWTNFMRFIPDAGVRVRDLRAAAGVSQSSFGVCFAGLKRWGYIGVQPDADDGKPRPPFPDALVRATATGRAAQAIWRPLTATIENRWRARFGDAEIRDLEDSLRALAGRIGNEAPHYLPVATYQDGMRAGVPPSEVPPTFGDGGGDASALDLPALLSNVLLALTVEFERESDVSLAIGANVLRVLTEQGVRARDLPGQTGVSKEAVNVSVSFLERRRYVTVESAPASERGKIVRPSAKGRAMQSQQRRLLRGIEERWQTRYGTDLIGRVREALETLIDSREGDRSRLALGLVTDAGGWRGRPPYLARTVAMLRDPGATLPHYPMVLFRGGWPDGS